MPDKAPDVTWKSIGTILWGFAITLVFVIVQTAVSIGYVLLTRNVQDEKQLVGMLESLGTDGQVAAIATIVTSVICIPIILGVIKIKKSSIISEYLALRPVSFKTAVPWFGLLALFLLASDAISSFRGRPIVTEFMELTYLSADPVWVLWVALVVAAPLFEETFFRGFLYTGLATGPTGPWGAIVISSAVWASIHLQYDLFEIGVIFLFGILLGVARMRCGSLLVPLGMHAAANFAASVQVAMML